MTSAPDLIRRLCAFGAIGLGSALGYIVVSTALVHLGYRPWIVSPLVYGACIPFAYLGQRNLTFRSKSDHSSSLPKYLAIQFVGLALATAIPAVVSGNVPPAVLFMIVTGLVAATNYILLARWAFPTKS
ncbi:GtrA family protein [Mesorhizobium sp. M1409]|uniref:GtrA family protein n=1 Tax=unclassified Mesorhizobium TaxID=325217 RepID=UPI00333BE246